ncbi:Sporulation-specific protein 71 [Candida viswanathii]|uniref:Sporulation-specific protein 71 n=1 Tax=Candida viswanathii TaxID=5486 RepID=A0A367XRV5_9ASCO|nr:Sporulation-specific protein 71 [Candida viswanathii]
MSPDENRFAIPRSSYLGTLLTYLTPETLSKCGRSLFVGGVPDLWHNDKDAALAKLLKPTWSSRLRLTNDIIKQYVGSTNDTSFFKRRDEILQNIESDDDDEDLTRALSSATSPDRTQDSAGSALFSPAAANETSGDPSLLTIHASLPKMKFEMPHPQTTVLMDPVQLEEENRRFRKLLKRFSKKAAGDRKPTATHSRIQDSIVKSYKVGEIIRIDKILVMVKKLVGSCQSYDDIDTRILERWREFIVVIRKTDSPTEPLMLQFYEIDKSPNFSHPKFAFRINSDIEVCFHSYLDKTISVTVANTAQYVLRLNNQENSLRWLFFMSLALGIPLNRVFNIYVPACDRFLQVTVPETLLHGFFKKSQDLVVIKRENGYEVLLDELLQYLKDFIYSKVPQHPRDSWFCFRHYDRIEWTRNTAELLFIQNSLFLPLYQLEYRQQCSIESEPMPIEGFLGRLTNTEGHEKSGFRDFFKILYFFTNRNLLFFTKYYRAIPPDGHYSNAVIEQNLFDPERITELLTECSQHVRVVEKEIGRRTDLIVNAKGLIDVADIVDIRVSSATPTQKLMQCTLWYSKPELVSSNDITESCFELVLKNRSVIKLQAPSRDISQVWMQKLLKVSGYWRARSNNNLCQQINAKAQNKSRLAINNYVDSNAPDQIDYLEGKNALANTVGINHLLPNMLVIKSGYLYQKNKKHASFNRFYAVLCPGFLIVYHTFKRSKVSGTWKQSSCFVHYITIPLVDCYLYSGRLAELDLLTAGSEIRGAQSDKHSVPRVYPDGWRSMEEDHLLCFTLWFGKKRNLTQYEKNLPTEMEVPKQNQKNPPLLTMIRKLGVTGKSIIFTAKSRQERDHWISCILEDMDRITASL